MSIREVVEGPQAQGVDEVIAYTIDTAPWGGGPSAVGVAVYELEGVIGTDVSADVLSGSATVDGDVITLPALHSLEEGKRYRVEVSWTAAGGNQLNCYFFVTGEL